MIPWFHLLGKRFVPLESHSDLWPGGVSVSRAPTRISSPRTRIDKKHVFQIGDARSKRNLNEAWECWMLSYGPLLVSTGEAFRFGQNPAVLRGGMLDTWNQSLAVCATGDIDDKFDSRKCNIGSCHNMPRYLKTWNVQNMNIRAFDNFEGSDFKVDRNRQLVPNRPLCFSWVKCDDREGLSQCNTELGWQRWRRFCGITSRSFIEKLSSWRTLLRMLSGEEEDTAYMTFVQSWLFCGSTSIMIWWFGVLFSLDASLLLLGEGAGRSRAAGWLGACLVKLACSSPVGVSFGKPSRAHALRLHFKTRGQN